MSLEVKLDERNQRFYAEIDDVGEAVLKYRLTAEDTLDYMSTVVPKVARGEGRGTELVRYALDYAQKRNYKVVPSCPFVEKVIEDHPDEYGEIVAE